jgi:hypothetical protein
MLPPVNTASAMVLPAYLDRVWPLADDDKVTRPDGFGLL